MLQPHSTTYSSPKKPSSSCPQIFLNRVPSPWEHCHFSSPLLTPMSVLTSYLHLPLEPYPLSPLWILPWPVRTSKWSYGFLCLFVPQHVPYWIINAFFSPQQTTSSMRAGPGSFFSVSGYLLLTQMISSPSHLFFPTLTCFECRIKKLFLNALHSFSLKQQMWDLQSLP